MTRKSFDSLTILTFGKIEAAKEECYREKKIWDVNVDDIVNSKLIKTKNDSKYLIGYSDDVINSSV